MELHTIALVTGTITWTCDGVEHVHTTAPAAFTSQQAAEERVAKLVVEQNDNPEFRIEYTTTLVPLYDE